MSIVTPLWYYNRCFCANSFLWITSFLTVVTSTHHETSLSVRPSHFQWSTDIVVSQEGQSPVPIVILKRVVLIPSTSCLSCSSLLIHVMKSRLKPETYSLVNGVANLSSLLRLALWQAPLVCEAGSSVHASTCKGHGNWSLNG